MFKDTLTTWINRILVADVFLVIFAFAWFIVALIGRSTGIPLGLDLWYKLWQPLFNPAIGILFAGAFINWGINKITHFLESRKTQQP